MTSEEKVLVLVENRGAAPCLMGVLITNISFNPRVACRSKDYLDWCEAAGQKFGGDFVAYLLDKGKARRPERQEVQRFYTYKL